MTTAQKKDVLTGRTFGEFVILEPLARGSAGMVYRAHQPSMNRDVALKVIDLYLDVTLTENFAPRFDQEAELIARLEHLHVLPVYAYGIVDDRYAFLAMRLMTGGTLADHIREGALPPEKIVQIFSQIGAALDYAHSHDVIHGDIKASNILLDHLGNAYLSDFGLARTLTIAQDPSQHDIMVGTPAYVSPEAIQHQKVDHRADLYSLGIVLFEILTGRLPYEMNGQGIAGLLQQHVQEPIPSIKLFNSELPSNIDLVMAKAIAKKPQDRYRTASEMVNELSVVLDVRGNSYFLGRWFYLPTTEGEKRGANWLQFALMALIVFIAVLVVVWLRQNSFTPIIHTPVINTDSTAEEPTHLPRFTMMDEASGEITSVLPSQEDFEFVYNWLSASGDIRFVAMISCNLNSATQAQRAREMADIARQNDISLRIYDTSNDPMVTQSLIRTVLQEGAQGFILCPFPENQLQPALSLLEQNNIPVVFNGMSDSTYGVKIDFQNHLIGRQLAEFAVEVATEEFNSFASILYVGPSGTAFSDLRYEAFNQRLREISPESRVALYLNSTGQQQTYETLNLFLQERPRFLDGVNVIIATNDDIALGIVSTLERLNISPQRMPILSVNGEASVVSLVNSEHYLRGTLAVDNEEAASAPYFSLISLMAGHVVPEIITTSPSTWLTTERYLDVSPSLRNNGM